MRLLKRNRQKFYYRNYISQEPITATDEWGNVLQTGEYEKTYGEVKSAKAYIKSAIGENSAEPFGDFTAKRRTIYIDNNLVDINEYSQLWIGIDPGLDESGNPTVPHNFTVDGISDGLNHDRILIRKVEVNV